MDRIRIEIQNVHRMFYEREMQLHRKLCFVKIEIRKLDLKHLYEYRIKKTTEIYESIEF